MIEEMVYIFYLNPLLLLYKIFFVAVHFDCKCMYTALNKDLVNCSGGFYRC